MTTNQDANNAANSARDTAFNDFLSEVSSAARDLTSTIRGSVTRAIQQPARTGTDAYPALDVYETADSVIIRTEPLDSAAPASVEVTMTGDKLTIKITTTGENEAPDESYLLRERRFGEFTRTLQIPRAVRAQEAQARLRKNGVLVITLPKIQDAGPRIIDVQMGE